MVEYDELAYADLLEAYPELADYTDTTEYDVEAFMAYASDAYEEDGADWGPCCTMSASAS